MEQNVASQKNSRQPFLIPFVVVEE